MTSLKNPDGQQMRNVFAIEQKVGEYYGYYEQAR